MPSLVGLTVSGAFARTGAAGLHIVSSEDVTPTASAAPAANATAPTATPAIVVAGSGIVAAQSPLAGHRVAKGDAVRLSVVH